MGVTLYLSLMQDHNGHKDKAFLIAGSNDTDAKSATTTITTLGFKGKEHPRECLNFWYSIQVSFLYA